MTDYPGGNDKTDYPGSDGQTTSSSGATSFGGDQATVVVNGGLALAPLDFTDAGFGRFHNTASAGAKTAPAAGPGTVAVNAPAPVVDGGAPTETVVPNGGYTAGEVGAPSASAINPVISKILVSGGAGHLSIDLELDANAAAAPASYISGWETAATLLCAAIDDPITCNLEVGYTDYPDNNMTVSSGTSLGGPAGAVADTYQQVRNFLTATGAPDVISAVGDLPNTSSLNGQSTFDVFDTEAKVFGQIGANNSEIDGFAGYGAGIPSDAIVGVALHEFTHAMGRALGTDAFALFRYLSSGAHDFTASLGHASYFSIDGGNTVLADFGMFSDPSDFLNSSAPNDPFDEFFSAGGTSQTLTSLDQMMLDMLGFGVTEIVTSGKTYTLLTGVTRSGMTVDSAGTLIVASGATAVAPTISGGRLDLQATAVVSGGITFAGVGGELQIAGSTMPGNTISGLVAGDTIDLASVAFSSSGTVDRTAGNVLQVNEGGNTFVLNLDPNHNFAGTFFQLSADSSASGTLVTAISGQPSPADFAGNGMSDILWQYENTENSGDPANGEAAIWLMNGATETSGAIAGAPPASWQAIAAGDFTGTGKADVIWQYENSANSADPSNGETAIWLMNGTTETSAAIVANPGSGWHVIGTGDFDGNGTSDILWQYENSANAADPNNGEPAIWLMNGFTETSGAGIANPGSSWRAVATGDFDGDGKSDIIWQYENSANPTDAGNGTTAIWLMNGTSETSAAIVANPGVSWHVVGTGDFNGDGKSDILWQYENSSNLADPNNGEAAIWLMNGFSETSGSSVGNPGANWHAVAAGDFIGNGKSDLLWQYENSANPADPSNGEAAIWSMNGITVTSRQVVSNPGGNWHVLA